MTGSNSLDAHISSFHDSWVGLLQRLIREPSVFQQEHSAVDLLESHLTALGLLPHRVSMDKEWLAALPGAVPPFSEVLGRDNLVVVIPGSGGGRSLVLNAHLDVTAADETNGWTHPPFAGTYLAERNVVIGRGAYDDKAGVVVALGVVQVLAAAGIRLAGDLVLHFVLDDEVTGNGSLACLEAGYRADAAIIIDGTRPDRAIRQQVGNLQLRLDVKGRPASVGVSHVGINAIEVMNTILAGFRETVFALNGTREGAWLQYPSPFQFVTLSVAGDGGLFTVPETATARAHVTFPPPWTLARMQALLSEVAKKRGEDLGVQIPASLTWGPLAIEPVGGGHPRLEAALTAGAHAAGITEISFTPSTGMSDMRHFSNFGIPCLLYGPGRGFNPHGADEYFMVEDFSSMVTLFAHAAMDWCGVAEKAKGY